MYSKSWFEMFVLKLSSIQIYLPTYLVRLNNRSKDIEGGQDQTTLLILNERHKNCDSLIQVLIG